MKARNPLFAGALDPREKFDSRCAPALELENDRPALFGGVNGRYPLLPLRAAPVFEFEKERRSLLLLNGRYPPLLRSAVPCVPTFELLLERAALLFGGLNGRNPPRFAFCVPVSPRPANAEFPSRAATPALGFPKFPARALLTFMAPRPPEYAGDTWLLLNDCCSLDVSCVNDAGRTALFECPKKC